MSARPYNAELQARLKTRREAERAPLLAHAGLTKVWTPAEMEARRDRFHALARQADAERERIESAAWDEALQYARAIVPVDVAEQIARMISFTGQRYGAAVRKAAERVARGRALWFLDEPRAALSKMVITDACSHGLVMLERLSGERVGPLPHGDAIALIDRERQIIDAQCDARVDVLAPWYWHRTYGRRSRFSPKCRDKFAVPLLRRNIRDDHARVMRHLRDRSPLP